jgi:DNA mismatch endonuclease (patch repair protein)
MARIRHRDTRPEMIVRSFLHQVGLRFRTRNGHLPGKPDIVLPSLRAAVMVHGCYWHRHPGCPFTTSPSSNKSFWLKKFAENVERDVRKENALHALGWQTSVIWECELSRVGALEVLAFELLAEKEHREQARRARASLGESRRHKP